MFLTAILYISSKKRQVHIFNFVKKTSAYFYASSDLHIPEVGLCQLRAHSLKHFISCPNDYIAQHKLLHFFAANKVYTHDKSLDI